MLPLLTEKQAREQATFEKQCWFRFDLPDISPHVCFGEKAAIYGVWQSRLVMAKDGSVQLFKDTYFSHWSGYRN